MKRHTLLMSILVMISLALAACGPTSEEPIDPDLTGLPGMEETPSGDEVMPPIETPMATSTEAASTPEEQAGTPTEAAATPDVEMTATPGAEDEGEVIPPTGDVSGFHLSTLTNYRVIDRSGRIVGAVSDYVINMCEAHLLYVVVLPDVAFNPDEESGQLLIPYEAFAVHGEVRTESNDLVLGFEGIRISRAPAVDAAALDMTNVTWEQEHVDYWAEIAPMTFTTECLVPPFTGTGEATPEPGTTPGAATPTPGAEETPTPTPAAAPGTGQTGADRVSVTRIAMASDVLGARLVDGNGEVLGRVEEALVVPETGLLRYVVVRADAALSDEQGLVLVPMGAVNVEHEGVEGVSGMALVLLVETSIFLDAPRVEQIPTTEDVIWGGDSFDYWSQHVPMTREELP
jgi:sporulation protein YlmC with PRC-barrel domain